MIKFPHYRQHDQMDCGPTCLRMIAKHHGRRYSMDTLRQKSGINREGVSLLGISEAAEEIGFRTVGAKLTWEQLKKEVALPCVVYWDQVHFVVVYKIKGDKVYIADPAKGKVTYPKDEFLRRWLSAKLNGQNTGIVLLLYTSPAFYDLEGEAGNRLSFGILFRYILPYKNLLFQLALGLLAGSIVCEIMPGSCACDLDQGGTEQEFHDCLDERYGPE